MNILDEIQKKVGNFCVQKPVKPNMVMLSKKHHIKLMEELSYDMRFRRKGITISEINVMSCALKVFETTDETINSPIISYSLDFDEERLNDC